MLDDKWHVLTYHGGDKVILEPPREIDIHYDDLWLEITGNMSNEKKKEIAQIVCDKLNKGE